MGYIELTLNSGEVLICADCDRHITAGELAFVLVSAERPEEAIDVYCEECSKVSHEQ